MKLLLNCEGIAYIFRYMKQHSHGALGYHTKPCAFVILSHTYTRVFLASTFKTSPTSLQLFLNIKRIVVYALLHVLCLSCDASPVFLTQSNSASRLERNRHKGKPNCGTQKKFHIFFAHFIILRQFSFGRSRFQIGLLVVNTRVTREGGAVAGNEAHLTPLLTHSEQV